MKTNNQKILISIFVFFIILLLSISIILANNVNIIKDYDIDNEKIYYEIKYLDSNIIYIFNLLYNEKMQINWDELKKQTLLLYNYWNTVILDLNYLPIDKKYLTDFSKELDELLLSVNSYNRNKGLSNMVKLYKKLTIYSNNINYTNYKNVLLAKYNLLVSAIIAETENWTLAHEYILKTSESILKVVNSMDINEYLQYNINQTYISVKELENIINIKNLNIFYFKYNILINKLDNLTF